MFLYRCLPKVLRVFDFLCLVLAILDLSSNSVDGKKSKRFFSPLGLLNVKKINYMTTYTITCYETT